MGGIPNIRFVITERREKVFILLSKGLNESEIAKQLNVGQSTICRDIKSIQKKSQKEIKSMMEDVLPYEFRRCMLSVEQIIKECWKIFNDTSGQWTNKNKIDSLKLIKEANSTRSEILLQGPVSLRAQQLEDKVRELVEEDEMPQKSYMNVRLPAIKGQSEEDLR